MNALKIVAVAGLLMGSASGSALAAGEGPYLDLTIGQMSANIPTVNLAGFSKDDSDSTYSIGAGYKINQYFGVEAGYQNLGQVSYAWSGAGTINYRGNVIVGTGALNISADIDGFYLGPTASFPINDQFSVNARAGWYRWEADGKASFTAAGTFNGTAFAAGATATDSAKGTDTYIGIGASYQLYKNVGINLGYTEYKIDEYKVKNWTVGARASF